ncbi:MAG: HAMP domain-containing sensor histidine kinase, partial [Bacteroidota bacterium]
LDPVIRRTDNVLITERLVDEIEQASRRISDLVKSIKSYTHMDQAIQLDAVDIRPGIENTLTMLGHKLKKKQIEVDLEIPEDLPQVHGIVGELNQVWTNLLDNAIDALPKGGLINIKAFCLPDLVRVKLIDNGTGIPEEVQSRIFEPFFTTKGIGEGTGLGLDIVKKVLHNHKGSIDLNSEPGRTEFCISLPISKK